MAAAPGVGRSEGGKADKVGTGKVVEDTATGGLAGLVVAAVMVQMGTGKDRDKGTGDKAGKGTVAAGIVAGRIATSGQVRAQPAVGIAAAEAAFVVRPKWPVSYLGIFAV